MTRPSPKTVREALVIAAYRRTPEEAFDLIQPLLGASSTSDVADVTIFSIRARERWPRASHETRHALLRDYASTEILNNFASPFHSR